MIHVLLFLWVVCALFIIRQQKVARIIICFCVFSMISSVCFLILGAPDVAMAEGAIGAFITIFFIICFEKYYAIVPAGSIARQNTLESFLSIKKYIAPLLFTIFLFGLFVYFIPDTAANTYLKHQYLSMFAHDIGGRNSVTAIYLGYRVYDTLLEALILLIGAIAVCHLSSHSETVAAGGHGGPLKYSKAILIVRIIAPLLLLFGIYLVINGYRSPGGGFQGGVLIAAFFVCRYTIHELYDIPIANVISVKKLVFVFLTLLAVFVVFLGFSSYFPPAHKSIFQNIYLITMNALIGIKVACGFVILFYRYIAIERR